MANGLMVPLLSHEGAWDIDLKKWVASRSDRRTLSSCNKGENPGMGCYLLTYTFWPPHWIHAVNGSRAVADDAECHKRTRYGNLIWT